MTGSDEDSKPKVIDSNLKVTQLTNNNNEQVNQFTTTSSLPSTTTTGKSSRYQQQRDGPPPQYRRDDKVNDLLIDRHHHRSSSTASVSPRSRSSSLDEDADSFRSGSRIPSSGEPVDGVVSITEIDKSVTSSSVVIDEEHANLCLSDEELELISKDEVITLYHRLQDYIDDLKRKHQDELRQGKETEAKLRVERSELSRREKVLMMRLTTRDRKLIEVEKEAGVLKSSIVPTIGALRSSLLDPAVNLIIQKLKKDLAETKKKLEDTQNDLNAWKFTPDSNTGKRLMAKCRMLYLENEDLGKQTSSGRVAKLENDLALNKQLVTEMKRNESEMDEVVQELDEDIEGLQSAIQHLQQELRSANEKRNVGPSTGGDSAATLPLTLLTPELNTSEIVTLSLSVLCAQCRLSQSTNKDVSGEAVESTALRTTTTTTRRNPSSFGEIDERTTVDLSGVENNERTSLLNGELLQTHPTPLNYIQSVQNVVNSSNSNSPSFHEEDQRRVDPDEKFLSKMNQDDGPPAKKTKLNITDREEEIRECHSSSSFNGNGAMEH